MTFENETQRAFLLELYRETQGDTGAQPSMYALGAKIGLDKPAAKKTAEDLIGSGWVEIRTLSGGIGITPEGIAAAEQEGAAPMEGGGFRLGDGPWIDETDRQGLVSLLEDLKKTIAGTSGSYADIEELVLDLKTIEVHLLSPRPKTAVIRELLQCVQMSLDKTGAGDSAGRIKRMLG